MNIVISLLVNTFAVYIASYVLEGVNVDSFLTAMIVAILLGIVNTIIKPILLLLTMPINLITLGLFTFVINGLLILFIDTIIKGFTVDNLLWAIVFNIIISLISSILNQLLKK